MNNLYANNIRRDLRGEEVNKKKVFDFAKRKENTICSLKDVNYFLCNFQSFLKYIKLYNILK